MAERGREHPQQGPTLAVTAKGKWLLRVGVQRAGKSTPHERIPTSYHHGSPSYHGQRHHHHDNQPHGPFTTATHTSLIPTVTPPWAPCPWRQLPLSISEPFLLRPLKAELPAGWMPLQAGLPRSRPRRGDQWGGLLGRDLGVNTCCGSGGIEVGKDRGKRGGRFVSAKASANPSGTSEDGVALRSGLIFLAGPQQLCTWWLWTGQTVICLLYVSLEFLLCSCFMQWVTKTLSVAFNIATIQTGLWFSLKINASTSWVNCDEKNNFLKNNICFSELLPRHFTVWKLYSHLESWHLDENSSLGFPT